MMSMSSIIGIPIFCVNRNTDSLTDENIGMSIGSRIREARKQSGLTQHDLATKAGMKQSTLSELETGESAGTSHLAKIASTLGVNALWLETGKGDRRVAVEMNTRRPLDARDYYLLDLFWGTDARGQDDIIATAERAARNYRSGAD